jgi:hypothetical protein
MGLTERRDNGAQSSRRKLKQVGEIGMKDYLNIRDGKNRQRFHSRPR